MAEDVPSGGGGDAETARGRGAEAVASARERFQRLGMRFPERPAPVDARGPLMLLRYSNN